MRTAFKRPCIYEDIEGLNGLAREELVKRWMALYSTGPFKGARQVTLIRGIAYKLQCKRLGELPANVYGQLLNMAAASSINNTETAQDSHKPAPKPMPIIKTGSRLIREWNGRTYVVSVTVKGFEMAGTTYGSLSAIAKAITGTQWSGPRFFGVRS